MEGLVIEEVSKIWLSLNSPYTFAVLIKINFFITIYDKFLNSDKKINMLTEKKLISLIDKEGFDFKLYSHEPLFTVKESIRYRGTIKGSHSKNLFLKNKKKQFFLFSCLEDTRIDLKKLSKSF